MDTPRPRPPVLGGKLLTKSIPVLGILLLYRIIEQELAAMHSNPRTGFIAAVAASLTRHGEAASTVDLNWHAPNATGINNLTEVIGGEGIYGFIYNSSNTPASQYGVYNWCNMPHVRATEYKKPGSEYKLQYVEVMHRHHKRTVYASNSFPVESYGWNCDDEGLFYYGQPKSGKKSAHAYWQGYMSPQNPFIPSGFLGTCQFPQITAEGLDDSWQHGQDLYGVYHDLLGFLPDNADEKVAFKVTQNVITSEVAGMVLNGMFGTQEDYPLLVSPSGYDPLEPTYPCPVSSNLSSAIQSGGNWTDHLTAASSLYATLDDISGVPPNDSGFHMSFDHYYDNLSARQCHGKPLPCKLVDGVNSTTCVTQDIANEVYRLGNYEYSYIYRDDPRSLAASATSFGVWIGELTTHIRDFVAGKSSVIYRHNVAHDGSISRLLSVLQLDEMVWPGMGSEVVFELYKKGSSPATVATAPTSGIASPSISAAESAPSTSLGRYYIRVLWKGQVLRSSNPSLGLMDMLPLETVLAYFDGLVGFGADMVQGKCNGTVPV
ncbi:Counting factor [Lachnellula occidentalis]|uniref:Counting factor n=1 Tax=Lachnellula occidentalis TaxID=215460 RepID=A0A8H8S575_9HELO|nr:Counting factor [Lachnellula occidentalis]